MSYSNNAKKTVNVDLKNRIYLDRDQDDVVNESFDQEDSLNSPDFDKYCEGLEKVLGSR
jgi:hypothetical protein